MTERSDKMREIKFRALFKKAWFYVTLKDLCSCVGISEYAVEDTEVERFTLGKHKTQFTGLKDKNGKEIYEGDIIKGVWGKNNIVIFKVIWDKRGCFDGEDAEGEPQVFDDFDGNLEVIGNIYENPELLKGVQQGK